jgi:hypothetical protein
LSNLTAHPIVVVEPQMQGLFHAPFNAALLHAVALAYPHRPVSFQAFPEHAQVVRTILQQHAPALIQRLEWRTASLPSAKSLPARWLDARRSIRQAAGSSEQVLFCSISRMQLLHLKKFLLQRTGSQVRAVLHGDLDRIEHEQREAFPKNLFSMERVLQMPHPPALRYLLLSESIRQHIPDRFRQALAESSFIDHPYHFPPVHPAPPEDLVFGVFGNSGDGRLLEQVVRSVKAVNPSVRFRLIGFLSNSKTVERLKPFVEDVTETPVSRETFIRLAQGISHTLWLAPRDSFRLRASGTFFDALAYCKPLVYTANPYIDPYYLQNPRIGTRCESIEEVASTILNLVENHTAPAYLEAQEAMKDFRRRFTPEALAETIPAALQWR